MKILAGKAKEKILALGAIILGGILTLGTCAFLGVSGIWGRMMGLALGILLGGFIADAISASPRLKVNASLAQKFIGFTGASLLILVPYILMIRYLFNGGVPRRHDYAEILGWTVSYSLIYAGVRVLWFRKHPRPSVA
jgi:hypothetical protein